ncbi:MAG: type II toxin-antitoxin system prevent-host-death family antitoxin [Bdellovibrionales bacterium]|nr:type II toxin-antitoxin system prevent-host-death family antitoxin [Bdellovibrionales bacterium]
MKKKIPISQFKAECLKILEQLAPEGIEVTKHGKPLARIYPVEQQSAALIGSLKGKLKKHGDTESTGAVWNAQS